MRFRLCERQGAHGLPLLAAAFALAVVAPLAEVLLCRGLIQRSLAARIGAVPALVLPAALDRRPVKPVRPGIVIGAAVKPKDWWRTSRR